MFTIIKFHTLGFAVLLSILGVAPIISVTDARPIKNTEAPGKVFMPPNPEMEGCSEWKWWLCWGNSSTTRTGSVFTTNNPPPKSLSSKQLAKLQPAAREFTERLQVLLKELERTNITRAEYDLINTKIQNLVQSNSAVLMNAKQWPNQITADNFKKLANELDDAKSSRRKIDWYKVGKAIGDALRGLRDGLSGP